MVPPSNRGLSLLGVSVGAFFGTIFWYLFEDKYFVGKYTTSLNSLLTGIDVLKKTFSRSWSRGRPSDTLRSTFPLKQ